MKYVFLLNPHACKDKLPEVLRTIGIAAGDKEHSVVYSASKGDLTDKAKECENSVLFSLGGDGTLFEIVNGMAESSNAVCVVPAGSGNDFCRSITNEKDYRKVLLGMDRYSVKKFDCGKADDLYFSNIASVGFDAEVVINSERFKRIPGLRRISYILALFYTLFTYKGLHARITVDGVVHEGRFLLCAVANGQYYGGGIRIAPTADPRDGVFDVYSIDSISMFHLFLLLPRLLNGSHTNLRCVHIVRASQVEIENEGGFFLNLDGELLEKKRTLINMIENGLNVFCD